MTDLVIQQEEKVDLVPLHKFKYEVDLRTVISFDGVSELYILDGYKETLSNGIEFMIETIYNVDNIAYLYITYPTNNEFLIESDWLNIVSSIHNRVVHFNYLGEYKIHLNIYDLQFSTLIFNDRTKKHPKTHKQQLEPQQDIIFSF